MALIRLTLLLYYFILLDQMHQNAKFKEIFKTNKSHDCLTFRTFDLLLLRLVAELKRLRGGGMSVSTSRKNINSLLALLTIYTLKLHVSFCVYDDIF